MLWLASRELIARRFMTLLTAAGLATATIGFSLLVGTTRTTEALVTGDLGRTWNVPYQLLVRPPGSQTALELTDGLVRPNFASGIVGGITLSQLAAIRAIPGVEVAAPIAPVGFVQWPAAIPLDLSTYAPVDGVAVFRVKLATSGEAGMSRYPSETAGYLVVAPAGRIEFDAGRAVLHFGQATIACDPPVRCYGGQTPEAQQVRGLDPGAPGLLVDFAEPFLIAGVDPAAEAALVGLDRCVSGGRYLTSSDRPAEVSSPVGTQTAVPVLVSRHSYIDETLEITIEQATDPKLFLEGRTIDAIAAWRKVAVRSASADDAYQAFLPTLTSGSFYDASPLWSVGDVSYTTVASDHLAAQARAPDLGEYETQLTVRPGGSPASLAPPEASDVWFRPLTRHDQVGRSELFSRWSPVGQFDPTCLPGFDPLAGGRLETYSSPEVRLGDGRSLGPTRSSAGYVTSPPLILTSLDTAAWFADPTRYQGAAGAAFIGAIRVRVAAAEEPGAGAEERVARVAADIHDATGLIVDIVAGSSPRKVSVDLPAGSFGRPALTVSELWSVKGVAVRFAQALNSQDVGIFSIVLIAATVLVGETAYLATRRRRPEFGVLRALGWTNVRIAWLVELEMLILGAAVGLVAVAVSALFVVVGGASLAPWQIAGVLPLNVAIAAIASVIPAIVAGRTPVVRLFDAGPIGRPPRVSSVAGFAIRELVGRRRIETGLGILTIALGVALVGSATLIVSAFAGQLDATILGLHVAARVRLFHAVIAVITLAVGAIAAAEIVTLGYFDAEIDFATLRALGWPRRLVGSVIVAQALFMGILGGLVGSAVVLGLGVSSNASGVSIASSVALGTAGAISATLLAALLPLAHLYRSDPAERLKGE